MNAVSAHGVEKTTGRKKVSNPSILDQLLSACQDLNDDELRPVLYLAERIQRGRQAYGSVFPTTDTRDFLEETRAEMADALNYITWRMAQG